MICLVSCWLFFVPLKNFSLHSIGTRPLPMADEGLQIKTHLSLSWPLSYEGSLASHIYFDIRHPFLNNDKQHVTLYQNCKGYDFSSRGFCIVMEFWTFTCKVHQGFCDHLEDVTNIYRKTRPNLKFIWRWQIFNVCKCL